MVTYRPLSR